MEVDLIKVFTDEQYEIAAGLFREYASWLNIDLQFQHFEEELKGLKKMYASPKGGIIICKKNSEYIGCVAVRRLDDATGELKRMYLKPVYQNKGIGKLLLDMALKLAKDCGYKSVRLDTLNSMLPAMKFYKKNGFIETAPYYNNPNSTAIYFQKFL